MIPAVVTHYWWPLKQLTGGRWLVRRQLPARPWHTTQKKKHWHKNYEKILKNRLGTRVYHSRCATMHMYPAPRPWQKNAFGWLVEPSRIFLVLVPRVTLSCCFPTIPRLKSTIWRVVPDLTLLLPPPQKKTSCTNYKIYIYFLFSLNLGRANKRLKIISPRFLHRTPYVCIISSPLEQLHPNLWGEHGLELTWN